MHALVGGSQPAERLRLGEAFGAEREGNGGLVPPLRLAGGVFHRVAVDPRRRPRLEAAEAQTEARERSGESDRGGFPDAPPRGLALARVHETAQERPRGDDHGARTDPLAAGRRGAGDPPVLLEELLGHSFDEGQAGCFLEGFASELRVERPIALGAGPPHGRPAGAVQDLELDAGAVGERPHEPAQGVDLAHELPLGEPADRGIARHAADRRDRRGQQGRAAAEARRGVRRLDARMPAADDEDVEVHGGKVSKGGVRSILYTSNH